MVLSIPLTLAKHLGWLDRAKLVLGIALINSRVLAVCRPEDVASIVAPRPIKEPEWATALGVIPTARH